MRNTKLMYILAILVIAAVAVAMLFTGCGQKQAEIEKFKAAYIRAVEDAYNKGEVNALDKFLAADYVYHHPPAPDIKGLEAYKQSIEEDRRSYPDQKVTIDSMIMEGDASASRWIYQATDASSGKKATITGCLVMQWSNGKVVEGWNYIDFLGFYQQVGYKISPPITDNTFARVTVTQMKPEKVAEAVKILNESVAPEAKKQKGYRAAYVLSDLKTGKGIFISIWDSEADAIANEQSGYYKAQVDKFKDIFTAKPVREGYAVTVQE